MTPAQSATIQALKEGNAWLIQALKDNQLQLAETRAELERVAEANKRLEARIRARAK